MKILIAMGDPRLRWATQKALRDNHHITEHGRMVSAFAKLEQQVFDLVVAGDVFVDGDGKLFLNGLRQTPPWRELPVVFYCNVHWYNGHIKSLADPKVGHAHPEEGVGPLLEAAERLMAI